MAGRAVANDDGAEANVKPPVTCQRPSVRLSVGSAAQLAPLRSGSGVSRGVVRPENCGSDLSVTTG